MVKTVTTREAEWDPVEQAKMLALAQHRREECDQCGGYLPETTDSANEGRYEVAGPFLCHSCEAMGRTHDGFAKAREQNPVYNMSRWSIRLRKE